MFAVTVTFVLKPDSAEAFLPLMVENARASKELEDGCHQFDVCPSDDDRLVFLYEVYDDEAAFKTHLDSDHFRAFATATRDMIETKSVQPFARILS